MSTENKNSRSMTPLGGLIALGVLLGGCAPHIKPVVMPPVTQVEPKRVVVVEKAPGMVEYVWERPLVDVVDVPPGLDPEGVYYRPSHQEIVEIRQGKWKYYKDK